MLRGAVNVSPLVGLTMLTVGEILVTAPKIVIFTVVDTAESP